MFSGCTRNILTTMREQVALCFLVCSGGIFFFYLIHSYSLEWLKNAQVRKVVKSSKLTLDRTNQCLHGVTYKVPVKTS